VDGQHTDRRIAKAQPYVGSRSTQESHRMTIILSEPHEPQDLGIPAAGQPAVDAAGAKPEKRSLSRLFMFRVSEDMHARIKALGGSKWLRKVISDMETNHD
jgi:hypothetical protein